MSTLPSVDVSVRTNSLGLQDAGQGDSLAIVGPAPSSTIAVNTPLLYGRASSIIADHVDGPLVEAAALGLEVTGRPVVLVRTATTTAGATSDIDVSAITGTAVPTAASGSEPDDDYEVYVEWVDGCTVGTTGGTYRWSLDGGRTMSALTALGTALAVDLGRGVKFNLDPASAQVTALIAYVNDMRTDFLAHIILTSGSVHSAADSTSDDGVANAASTGAEAISLVNTIRAAAILHAANLTAHGAADSASFASLPAAATTLSEAVKLAIALRAAYDAHRVLTTGGVHGAADSVNGVATTAPVMPTLAAGDSWTARAAAPKWNDAQLDAAMLALQRSGYSWKSVLILGPLTNTNTSALKTRWSAMFAAYKYKSFFGHFRMPSVGESESTYLAAFKSAFDTISDFYGMSVSAGSFEVQSCATKPRIYRRPPAWMAAAMHVRLGPAESLAAVNDGDGAWQWGARIADENNNPKHHDEDLDPGLDAARALTLRSVPGHNGKVFVTRARTLATLGTDFMWIHYWAAMREVLIVAIPKLIGQIQKKMKPDTTTGRIAAEAANDIEKLVEHDVNAKVTAAGVIVSFKVVMDRTVNVYQTPKIPVTLKAVPYFYPDGFSVTAALDNPSYSNA